MPGRKKSVSLTPAPSTPATYEIRADNADPARAGEWGVYAVGGNCHARRVAYTTDKAEAQAVLAGLLAMRTTPTSPAPSTPAHTAGPWKIIRVNTPDQPDDFAVIGPGSVRDEGFTSADSALRSALSWANDGLRLSSARLFEAQGIAVRQGEALAALVRGAEMLDDYCMGGSRPPAYDLAAIRATLNDAANAGRQAMSTPANARLIAAAPELLAALRSIVGYAEAEIQTRDSLADDDDERKLVSLAQSQLEAARAALARAEGGAA